MSVAVITGYQLGSAPPRFRSKVRVAPSGCWEWVGFRSPDGYGRWKRSDSNQQLAHRHAYTFYIAPIPDGLTIDHLCRNRACVNPMHLEAVTLHENILRGDNPAARRARQRECVRGHKFTAANTYPYPDGRRGCRKCRTYLRRKRYLETGE